MMSQDAQLMVLRATLALLVSARGKDVAAAREQAHFVLENPDAAAQAVQEHQTEQQRLVADVRAFLATAGDDTSSLQRRIDRIMALHGARSNPGTCVRDLRGKAR